MKETTITIITAILAIAILAVLVSKKSNFASAIQSFGAALTQLIGIVEQPITQTTAVKTNPTTGLGIGGV